MYIRNWSQLIVLIAGMMIPYLYLKRYEKKPEIPDIRSLPALEVVPEMVGRAAEMNAKVLVIPGYSSALDARLLSGLSILSMVAEETIKKGTKMVVATPRPPFMPLIEEAAITGFTRAGSPNERVDIRFLTDQQFAFCAAVMGIIERENCQANFFVGGFADEALPISAAGMAIGAMQIAGDWNMYQLPYFVCTCDYVMISEELLVTGAILSRDKGLLGGVIGSDVLKYVLMILGALGIIATSLGSDFIIKLLSY
jgi:hypothetical protein